MNEHLESLYLAEITPDEECWLDERGQGAPHWLEQYAAVLEYEGCSTLAKAVELSQNLSKYDFVSCANLREYALQELAKNRVPMSELVADCFDYEAFAADLLEKRGFLLTADESAYIASAAPLCRLEQTEQTQTM